MSTITAVDVSNEEHEFFRDVWDTFDRDGPSSSTVHIIEPAGITYDNTTDSFLFTTVSAEYPNVLFYNINPNTIFSLSFSINWKLYHTTNIFRIAWGDETSRFQVELAINTTTSVTTFVPTRVRLLYKASDGKIYQIISTTVNAIFSEKDHFCMITSNEVGTIEFSIDGVTIISVNNLDILRPGQLNAKLIDRLDINYFGAFAFCYDHRMWERYPNLRPGMGDVPQNMWGSLTLKNVGIKNYSFFTNDVVIDGSITAKEYDNLDAQPLIAGMSNLLYNELKHQKLTLTYNNYGVERQYPSVRSFNANTYTISGQAYGNGEYKVSSAQTPVNASTTQPYRVLDGTTNTFFQAADQYSFTNSTYTGIPFSLPLTDGTLKEYKGIEVTLQIPVNILLTKLMLHTNVQVTDHCILASDDGSMWTEIYTQTGLTISANTLNTISLPSTHTTPYKYYKYVLQKINPYFTGNNTVQINELYLLGREFTVDTFFSASNNKVGLGTTSPSAPLHVIANSTTNPNTNAVWVFNQTNSANNHAIIGAQANTSGGNAYLSLSINNAPGWSIGVDNSDSKKLKFINSWNYSGTPAMTIDQNRNVGIGTTVPAYRLDISGAMNSTTLYENGQLLSAKYALASSIQTVSGATSTSAGTVKISDTYPVTSTETDTTVSANVARQIYNLSNGKWSAVDASETTKGIVKFKDSYSDNLADVAASCSAVKAAYDLANGKWSAVDASETTKGIVKFKDSYSDNLTDTAASCAAVKTAYDLANGKWSAVDASSTTKGILKFKDSYSDNLTDTAASCAAVKAAYDLANTANGKVSSQWTAMTGGISYNGNVSATGTGTMICNNFHLFNNPSFPWDHMWLHHDGSTAYIDGGGCDSGLRIRVGTGNSSGVNGQTYTTCMTLLQSGNVGIGTTSPSAPLHVIANSTTTPNTNALWIYNPTNSANNHAIIGAQANTSGGNAYLSLSINNAPGWSIGVDNGDSRKLKFVNAWDYNGTSAMTIDQNRNVGINTTTPASRLTVNGNCSIGTYTTAAPANGLIVSGNVGLGTSSPGTYKLSVTGNTYLNGNVDFNGNLSGIKSFTLDTGIVFGSYGSSRTLKLVCYKEFLLNAYIDSFTFTKKSIMGNYTNEFTYTFTSSVYGITGVTQTFANTGQYSVVVVFTSNNCKYMQYNVIKRTTDFDIVFYTNSMFDQTQNFLSYTEPDIGSAWSGTAYLTASIVFEVHLTIQT